MKAARKDYSEAPFFFTEKFEDGERTLVWHSQEDAQRELFFKLLSEMDERIDYLFKEDTGGEGYDQWVRISGGMYKADLIKLIKRYRKWFFTDSIFQFCCREPEVGGYFAYDEHGIFFIYDKDVTRLLTELGYDNRNAELLSNAPHWQIRPKNCEKTLPRFKEELKRKSVFFSDESQPDG